MRTLYQLKQLVEVAPASSLERVPSCRELINSGAKIVEFARVLEDRIYVWDSGYVLYLSTCGPTVIPLHAACRGYKYNVDERDKELGVDDWQISESYFDSKPWPIRVMLEASDRIEHNKATGSLSKNTMSYDVLNWEAEFLADTKFNALAEIERKELIELMIKGLNNVKAEQWEILLECVIRVRTLTDVADEKGLSVQSVRERKERGLNNVRRVFNKNGYSIKLTTKKRKPKKASAKADK